MLPGTNTAPAGIGSLNVVAAAPSWPVFCTFTVYVSVSPRFAVGLLTVFVAVILGAYRSVAIVTTPGW